MDWKELECIGGGSSLLRSFTHADVAAAAAVQSNNNKNNMKKKKKKKKKECHPVWTDGRPA